MNGSVNIQPADCSIDEEQVRYFGVSANAGGPAWAIAPADRGTFDIRMKRLQQYATHMEAQLLHKYDEVNALQSVMESNAEEMRQMQVELERVSIYQARHAAMEEILGAVAHKWRQPLNCIALIIQNIVDAWKYGEMTDELLERSGFRAMEQINLLSCSIDDFRSSLDPDSTADHFELNESTN